MRCQTDALRECEMMICATDINVWECTVSDLKKEIHLVDDQEGEKIPPVSNHPEHLVNRKYRRN